MLLGVTAPIIAFELLTYTFLGLCTWHALQQGPWRRMHLIELGTGVLYGLTLETLTILQFHAYRYGHFLIMFGSVPLAVGVGWGIILYSAMAFVDAFALPAWAAPALVGLLGLNIDFSIDAVAIRLHMWQWLNLALNEQWFGVLYANFYAWFIVLCSSSALLWLVRPLTSRPGWRGLLAALGALLGSVLILVLLDELVLQYDAHGGIAWLPVVIVIAGALAVVGWGQQARARARACWPQPSRRPSSGRATPGRGPAGPRQAVAPPLDERTPLSALVPMAAPFYFHLFFLSMLFIANIAVRLPVLVGISLVMLALSLVLHSILVRRALLVRSISSAHPVLSNETFRAK